MFAIGDKIVYPMHGAGTIISIEKEEVLGEEKDYYIILMPIKKMKVMVPVDKAKEVGVREVSNEDRIIEVLEILAQKEYENQMNWSRRYRKNLDKIKGGDICDIAEVVRNLQSMHEEKGLSTGEKKMLDNATQILTSEIALVKDIKEAEARELIFITP